MPADNTPSKNQVNTHEQHTSPRTIINETDKVENNDFVPLPPKRTSGKNALRLKCRNLMKELSSLTFLIDDKQQLSFLVNDLETILDKARKEAPREAGIIIQTTHPKRNPIRKTNGNIRSGKNPEEH